MSLGAQAPLRKRLHAVPKDMKPAVLHSRVPGYTQT